MDKQDSYQKYQHSTLIIFIAHSDLFASPMYTLGDTAKRCIKNQTLFSYITTLLIC